MWYWIVSIPDLCGLSYFALASNRYCSTHCDEVVDVLEKKKLNCKNYHFQELYFSKVSQVCSISESFGKLHLSLILTNQCLTIMVRSRTVINIVPLWWHCPYMCGKDYIYSLYIKKHCLFFIHSTVFLFVNCGGIYVPPSNWLHPIWKYFVCYDLKEFAFSHDKATSSLKEYFHALEMNKMHIYVVFTY